MYCNAHSSPTEVLGPYVVSLLRRHSSNSLSELQEMVFENPFKIAIIPFDQLSPGCHTILDITRIDKG